MSGSWRGTDPLLRILRTISLIAFLGFLCVLVVDPGRNDNFPLLALLVGAVLIQLGYDVILRIPGFIDRRDDHDR